MLSKSPVKIGLKKPYSTILGVYVGFNPGASLTIPTEFNSTGYKHFVCSIGVTTEIITVQTKFFHMIGAAWAKVRSPYVYWGNYWNYYSSNKVFLLTEIIFIAFSLLFTICCIFTVQCRRSKSYTSINNTRFCATKIINFDTFFFLCCPALPITSRGREKLYQFSWE